MAPMRRTAASTVLIQFTKIATFRPEIWMICPSVDPVFGADVSQEKTNLRRIDEP